MSETDCLLTFGAASRPNAAIRITQPRTGGRTSTLPPVRFFWRGEERHTPLRVGRRQAESLSYVRERADGEGCAEAKKRDGFLRWDRAETIFNGAERHTPLRGGCRQAESLSHIGRNRVWAGLAKATNGAGPFGGKSFEERKDGRRRAGSASRPGLGDSYCCVWLRRCTESQ